MSQMMNKIEKSSDVHGIGFHGKLWEPIVLEPQETIRNLNDL